MTHFAHNNHTLAHQEETASPILKHLMGASALELETGERQRLKAARWLVKNLDKSSPFLDQGGDREVVGVILSGAAFRYHTLANGKRQILDFVFAGSLVGFGSGTTYSYGVETITPCAVATLSYGEFRRLLATCPSLAMRVVEGVCDSEMRAHEHMTSLGRRSTRERIAGLIVELTCRAKCTDLGKREYSIDLPVTQVMIGDALGLSNEHVCRVLGQLVHDGLIEIRNHTLRVLDLAAISRDLGTDTPHPFNRETRIRSGVPLTSRRISSQAA